MPIEDPARDGLTKTTGPSARMAVITSSRRYCQEAASMPTQSATFIPLPRRIVLKVILSMHRDEASTPDPT